MFLKMTLVVNCAIDLAEAAEGFQPVVLAVREKVPPIIQS
jgi:hypothetical protein